MIINCPKCEFEQPKEDFCARCGVDMYKYKKKPPPIKDRIFKDSSVYIVLILSVLIGLSFYIKNHWFSSQAKPYSFQPAAEKQSRDVASADLSNQPLNIVEKLDVSKFKKTNISKKTNPYLEIRVVKMPTSFLAFFVGKHLNKDLLSRFSSTQLTKENESYLAKIPSTQTLFQTTYYLNSFQDPFLLQQTVYDSKIDDDLGFYINMNTDSIKQKQLILNIALRRNFYKDKQSVTNESLNEKIEIAENQTLILYGILPHKNLNEQESQLFQAGYLSLLGSPDFQSLESTFVIILTFKY